MKLKIFTDGGSRGNPGDSGIGVLIQDENGKELEKRYKYVGTKTNNESEYTGLYYGILRGIELKATKLEMFLDSQLVVNQMNSTWKVKDKNLQKLNTQVRDLIKKAGIEVTFTWIPREQNTEADRLSNIAMDSRPII